MTGRINNINQANNSWLSEFSGKNLESLNT
jgi:hypothetical protein